MSGEDISGLAGYFWFDYSESYFLHIACASPTSPIQLELNIFNNLEIDNVSAVVTNFTLMNDEVKTSHLWTTRKLTKSCRALL